VHFDLSSVLRDSWRTQDELNKMGAAFGPYAAFSTFFAAARFNFASAARLSAQRFFVAAMIRFMPSALIRRFCGFDPAREGAWDCPLIAAHLCFWASAIRRREAALT
jgi:hypothetical protein